MYFITGFLLIKWTITGRNYFHYSLVERMEKMNPTVLNSNTLASVIVLSTILMHGLMMQKGMKKVYILMIDLAGIYVVLNCWSRSSFFSLALFVLITFWISRYDYRWNKYLFVLFIGVIIMGFMYPLMYVICYLNVNDPASFSLLNKHVFSGRELLWSEMFQSYKSNLMGLFVGQPMDIKLVYVQNTGNNLESWYLKLLYQNGIFGTIMYLIFLTVFVRRIIESMKTPVQATFFVGYIAVLIIGYNETIMSFYTMAVLCYFPLALSCNQSLAKSISINKRRIESDYR